MEKCKHKDCDEPIYRKKVAPYCYLHWRAWAEKHDKRIQTIKRVVGSFR